MKKKIKPVGGVYQIRFLGSGRAYIGQSKNIRRRLATHRTTLRCRKHHCNDLQEAYNKHGPSMFVFEVIYVENDPVKRVALETQEIQERIYPYNTAHANKGCE